MLRRYRIHPTVGIARIGNGRVDSYVPGPETPGKLSVPVEVGLRDASGALKRQGARFRVFEYSDFDSSRPAKEVHVNGVIRRIEWTVHLAHRKPSADVVPALERVAPHRALRNAFLSDPDARQAKLVLDPGPAVLNGPGIQPIEHKACPALLASLQADPAGRMTLVAGDGSAWSPSGEPLASFVDNDGWFDGQCDGIVSARLIFANGDVETAAPAWVVVAPPRFAPGSRAPVTLYDVLYDRAVRFAEYRPQLFDPERGDFDPTYRPSFMQEIVPILRAAQHATYLFANAAGRCRWDYAALNRCPFSPELHDRHTPEDIVARIRPPGPDREGDPSLMPLLFGDGGPGTWLSLTATQYHVLQQWRKGCFIDDWRLDEAYFGNAPLTPELLDRAALEDCVGAPLRPGYEVGALFTDPRIVDRRDPFRIRLATALDDPHGLLPGMATMSLPVPWHAGLFGARSLWWPSHRPGQVRIDLRSHLMKPWDRGVDSPAQMLDSWWQLGLVRPTSSKPGAQLIERERLLNPPTSAP